MRSRATLSPCRSYRYTLTREWDPAKPTVNFVGLNPSTADEQADDPTIRRCVADARAWGFGRLVMTNLFAWRATDPRELLLARDPIGPENDRHLIEQAAAAARVLGAWGAHGALRERARDVLTLLRQFDVYCLAVTKGGHPGHPLSKKANLVPVRYR